MRGGIIMLRLLVVGSLLPDSESSVMLEKVRSLFQMHSESAETKITDRDGSLNRGSIHESIWERSNEKTPETAAPTPAPTPPSQIICWLLNFPSKLDTG